MRLVFFLLLLLNVALYPFVSGLIAGKGDGSEPLRMASQMKPDSIRILPSGGEAPIAEALASPDVEVAIAADTDAPAVCRALDGLSREQVDALTARIGAQQLALQLSDVEQTETTAWWVHIPDMQTRQLAERKQAELRALGVREMIVMADPVDSQKLAVSLGLFKTEAAAKELLATLNGQGVRSARIAPREGRAGRYRVEVRGGEPELAALFDSFPALDETTQRTDCQ
ncbi:SPOR domain-containing protein [Methyloversatilis sp.]|uniref:SPOR domain-containing protein n=1 Tax=Methyloversatilis sp. TaxID=2569862 RepID=UPI0027325CBE|nr:SPOR domain-containing protein [Methyloversatilis sp.]MDP2870540.1 SPOR domain-containing protein [Methyloversatilis sp.]MDP3289256.1 SPOR domain-containing protein [Methyloversatilis sp.]MDP3455421.1 SPOR domain-containing protein [Methyloversatilis sp.]MDP3578082.1 SPOR domain-containing protein [Methyloversatilis sp.]